MWTAQNRGRYDRRRLHNPSDLTDEEWTLIGCHIPPAKRGGNKWTVNLREVLNGLMYILSTDCQWRAIPKDLPPRSTLYDYFDLWSWDGTLDRIHHALYFECRERAEREPSPTAAIIDSQRVKSAEKRGLASIRMATIRARKSRARSGTFDSAYPVSTAIKIILDNHSAHTSLPNQRVASNLPSSRSIAPGSISSKASSPSWRAPCSDTSEFLPNTSSQCRILD